MRDHRSFRVLMYSHPARLRGPPPEPSRSGIPVAPPVLTSPAALAPRAAIPGRERAMASRGTSCIRCGGRATSRVSQGEELARPRSPFRTQRPSRADDRGRAFDSEFVPDLHHWISEADLVVRMAGYNFSRKEGWIPPAAPVFPRIHRISSPFPFPATRLGLEGTGTRSAARTRRRTLSSREDHERT
jgi:hypothetical protein